MEPFQLVFLMFQIAFALVLLYIPYFIISRIIRAGTKTTRKTYSSFRN